MPKIEVANILLALGGDNGNTVPKYSVTVAEVAVLRVIHGNEAVTDVQPTGFVETTHRAEIGRLMERYGRSVDGRFEAKAVTLLFPGAAARVFERFEELEMPEEFYKAETRVSMSAPQPVAAAPKPEAPLEVDHEAIYKAQAELDAANAASAKANEPLPVATRGAIVGGDTELPAANVAAIEAIVANDGIGDMNDGVAKEADVLG